MEIFKSNKIYADHWHESSYVEPSLISYYADLANFFLILILLIYFKERKIIDIKFFAFLNLSLVACFLFNNLIFDWSFFPDQNKYVVQVSKIRDQLHNIDFVSNFGSSYQFFSSLTYSLIPLPFIETINSLSFFNKLLFILFTVYAYHKKIINNQYLIIFIFFPSVLLYSSLSLKDNLVYVLNLWVVYCIINRENLKSIILIALLTSIKLVNGLVLSLFLILYKILFSGSKKEYFKRNFIFLGVICLIITSLYQDIFLEKVNFHMYNLHEEAAKDGTEIQSFNSINNIGEFIFKFISSSVGAFFNPVLEINKNYLLRLVLVFENIVFILVLVSLFKKYFKKIEDKFIFWFSYLLLNYGIFNMLLFNAGTFGRYKYPITLAFIFAILCEIKEKNKIVFKK